MADSLNIDQKQVNRKFYRNSTVIKTMRPFDPGTTKYRHKAAVLVGDGKLVAVRYHKGPGGEKRTTIEIEI